MEFFGLDIGSYKIKIAQLKREADNQYRLLSLASGPSTAKGLLSEADADLTALAEAVKKVYQESGIKTRNVVTALPQDQVFTQVITMPKLSKEELESALKWEAEQHVPHPIDEVTLSHQMVGKVTEQAKEKSEVLLAAAPNRLIEKMIKVLKNSGLVPVSLETEIMAMARSLFMPQSPTALLIDLGARATDLAVIQKGKVVFTRSIATAGEALTRAIAINLGLESGQAEAYKKAYGVDAAKLEGKVRAAISPVLDAIIKEIEKTIQFYRTSGKDRQIKRIILTGGTAGLPAVTSLLSEKVNLEIQQGDPFVSVIKDELSNKIPKKDTPFYATAVGLAMKELD